MSNNEQITRPDLSDLFKAVELYRIKEANCPANKTSLGDKDCPKCGASSNEPCRETVRAAFAVVDAAKYAFKIGETE